MKTSNWKLESVLSREKMQIEIWWNYDEDGSILIDQEEMQNDFDHKLSELVEKYEKPI